VEVAAIAWKDYQRGGRSDRPAFLLKHLPVDALTVERRPVVSKAVKRQMKRLVQ
jgi:hypothetical protein